MLAAQVSLPDVDEVGVSIAHRGRIEMRAATGPIVWDLDSIQHELGEGPCVSAMRDNPVVLANDLRHDERWPRHLLDQQRHAARRGAGGRAKQANRPHAGR